MLSVWPVTQSLAADARYTSPPTSSSGSPKGNGMDRAIAARTSGVVVLWPASVFVQPGAIALTRMPSFASSLAREIVIETMPSLVRP